MTHHLILDGYNIIGALQRYSPRVTGGFDESRELLINDALKAAGWTGRRIILVFDATRSPDPGRSELRAGGAVRLMYSARGESADDVIERLVRNLGTSATVCSGDFALQRAALAGGAARSVPREFGDLLDELPVVTSNPNTPFRARVADRLSPEVLHDLERIRREAEGRQ
ncbi:MAG: NYN domain-containing protein [Actinomycetota bacterium]|jgi:predicted RNA-binding protein with PIN domain|nr:NYN domain-containing protein [Actinomycetota bacterium]